MEHQDWNTITLRNSARIAEKNRQAQPKRSAEAQRLAKVEREEFVKSKTLAPESRQELVKRRLEEKMSQQQLDQRCSFPAHTIRDIEGNKRCPTNHEIQTIGRVLKINLKLV